MFGPTYEAACPGCTGLADHFDGALVHLNNRDVTLIALSRAPIEKLKAYKRRMGWTFAYVSSYGSDFNFDFDFAFTEEQMTTGELKTMVDEADDWLKDWAVNVGTDLAHGLAESPGWNVFKLEDGVVYHTYSRMARDRFLLTPFYFQLLDQVPDGRDGRLPSAPSRRVLARTGRASISPGDLPDAGRERVRRLPVGRVEGHERELSEREVAGGSEGREGAEEGEVSVVEAKLVHQHDVVWIRCAGGVVLRDPRVGDELVVQGLELGIAGGVELAAQPREHVAAPIGEIRDPRRHAVRVQRDAQRVRRRLTELRRDPSRDVGDAEVRGHDVPVAVHGKSRIRLVC
jgi:Bacterial protein of unknown function (DUF899)